MNFDGHQLVKLDNKWTFDLTTFIGYKVSIDGETGQVIDYTKAFVAVRDKQTGDYSFDKLMRVPVKILRQTVNIIQKYREEALLEHGHKSKHKKCNKRES